jgi:hypothetical protein
MIEYYRTEFSILRPDSLKTQRRLIKGGSDAGVPAVIPADMSIATVSGHSVVSV